MLLCNWCSQPLDLYDHTACDIVAADIRNNKPMPPADINRVKMNASRTHTILDSIKLPNGMDCLQPKSFQSRDFTIGLLELLYKNHISN